MLQLKELMEKQKALASQIVLADNFSNPPSTLAGVDVTFLEIRETATTALAAIVVLSYPELKVIESAVAKEKVSFPYIPGFLAFRELPPIKRAYEKLSTKADIYLVDGQGIAHPRALGIASHFGVDLNVSAIGCAKNLLYGSFEPPAMRELASSPLFDKLGHQIGTVIRPRGGSQLIFVSPGHLVSVESATELVRKLFLYSIPEPIRLAHILLQNERRKLLGQTTLI